jgi:tRNA/rRNA methyltransferase
MSGGRVRFVLVEPSHPGNIGAAARALKVMGFTRLHVVAPRDLQFSEHPEAVALAVGAADVLAGAAVCADLPTALDGVQTAYAMSGYTREFGPRLVALREAAAEAREVLAGAAGDVAFVFGTERTGLANEDVERCQACCAIPADPAFSSLNLAQAVQVVAYECRLALLDDGAAVHSRFIEEPAASVPARAAMLDHLEQALIALGYLNPAVPGKLMPRLRRLLNRAQPSAADIDILRGMAAAMIERKSERIGRKDGVGARNP